MTVRNRSSMTALVAVGLLTGCANTPMGPTVPVMPGQGKSFDIFQSDVASCKNFAAQQVAGQADAANKQAVGGALIGTAVGALAGGLIGGNATGAVAGGAAGGLLTGGVTAGGTQNTQIGIQQQYDIAFSQCMYARGDQVPGYAPQRLAPVAGSSPDQLVRSVQSELIRLNYLQDGADGEMGPLTASAIRDFQRSNGLPADGSPSPSLLARLQSSTVSTRAPDPSN